MAASGRLRVLISGGGGMLGSALRASIGRPSAANFFRPAVGRLLRAGSTPLGEHDVFWDPYEMRVDMKRLEDFDAVVHLAGESIGGGRWSDRQKHLIMESRRRGTSLLAEALAHCKMKPKVFISASGVGYYGNGGDAVLTEASPKGTGFLSEVASVWEEKTAAAAAAGIRTVNLRFGVILSRNGGALQRMYWPFFFGMGGPIGSGTQYMSWITLDDAVRAIEHAIARPELSGVVNACAPNPVRNSEFVAALASAMGRPAIVPMPEVAVRTLFGEMGEETLLTSQRAVPEKLLASGFRFLHPDIDSGMRAALAH